MSELCQAIFARLSQQNPHPKTDLVFSTPFECLVAVMLSAQSTDVSVNKATPALFAVANTPAKMLGLGEQKLRDYINAIGLYRNKAKYIIHTATQLITLHDSQVPADRAALEALPGVGRKTANVVLNNVFDMPYIGVDTHVFRVANRTGMAVSSRFDQVESLLMQRIPTQYIQRANHWFVLHGRYFCKARKPACHQCPLRDLCAYAHTQTSTKNEEAG